MTKRREGVSSGNWFEGSQVSKARPGAPFGFTLRYCRGHTLCHFSPDSLCGSTAPRDDKGESGVSSWDRSTACRDGSIVTDTAFTTTNKTTCFGRFSAFGSQESLAEGRLPG